MPKYKITYSDAAANPEQIVDCVYYERDEDWFVFYKDGKDGTGFFAQAARVRAINVNRIDEVN